MSGRTPYGWAGSVGEFLTQPPTVVVSSLEAHLERLMGFPAAPSQVTAWLAEETLMRACLRDLAVARPDISDWGIAFEYELHLEGGRRPDVILHSGEQIFVLEFKQAHRAPMGAVDQVVAYARDLAEYHKASHDVPVVPVLVLTQAHPIDASPEGIHIVAPVQIGALLEVCSTGSGIDMQRWLDSPYEPLPTLVEAARMIFREEPLPRIRRAESAGIPAAVDLLVRLQGSAPRLAPDVGHARRGAGSG